MIETISKGLSNKKLLLSIIVLLRYIEFPKHLLRLLFWVKFINVEVVTQNWNNIGSNVYVSTAALLFTFQTKKSQGFMSVHFYKNSLILTCCTFGRFKIRTLTPNRLKKQTNDTLKLLDHNYSHQRGFLKQKIVTLHHCGFNLKFPKHC